MAKFCTKCGKKLDGKPCNCEIETIDEKVENKEKEQETVETSTNETLNYLNAFIEITKDMFTKPITALKENIKEENWITGMIAIFLNIFLLSGFACIVVKERLGNMNWGMEFLSMDISYAKIFIQSFVSLSILYFAFAGILYFITDKICKKKTSYPKMVAFLGTISTVNIVINVLAIICVYLSLELMTTVLLMGILLTVFYLYKGFSFTAKIDENKVPYLLTISITILFVLAFYVIPGILN